MKNNAGFQTVALTRIHESTTNPRSTFDESKLAELAASLRTQGLIQPITVRPNSDGYEIVAGARRFRAAQLAELFAEPVPGRGNADPPEESRRRNRGTSLASLELR